MKTFGYLVLACFIILVSCSDNTDENSGLSIGVTGNGVVVKKIDPPLTIINPGSDSVDLDGDLHCDLIFIKSPEALLTGFGIKTEMIKKPGVQVCISKLNPYPDTLLYSSRLSDRMNWSHTGEARYILQGYDCHNGNNCLSIGNFLNLKERYLGVKIDGRFGWVKIVNEVTGPLMIKEFALTD